MYGMLPYQTGMPMGMADYPGLSPYHHHLHPAHQHHPHHHQSAAASAHHHAAAVAAGMPQAFPHSCILELRKEKSRDAARSRRGKENKEFYELAKMLPLPGAITSQLDKASIVRLTISYLKLRDFSEQGDPPWAIDVDIHGKHHIGKIRTPNRHQRSPLTHAMDVFDPYQGQQLLQSLDGFVFILASDGRFLYISETVSIYLGLSQVEMTGSSVFDYIHPQDQAELAEQLGLILAPQPESTSGGKEPKIKPSTSPSDASSASMDDEGGSHHHGSGRTPSSAGSPGDEDSMSRLAMSPNPHNPDVTSPMTLSSVESGLNRSICLRMKSTLTKRGCHFKSSSGYRVVQLIYRLRPQYPLPSRTVSSSGTPRPPPLLGMAGIAVGLPPPSVPDVRLEEETFVARLGLDFKIVHCEAKVSELLDYTAEEMSGRSLYKLCHAEDISILRKSHVDLIKKGQISTPYYRILNKRGGFTWIQTCATIVCNSKTSQEQNIICINNVISACEFENFVLDACQLGIDVDLDEKDVAAIKESHREASNGRSQHPQPHEAFNGRSSISPSPARPAQPHPHTPVIQPTSRDIEYETADDSGDSPMPVGPADHHEDQQHHLVHQQQPLYRDTSSLNINEGAPKNSELPTCSPSSTPPTPLRSQLRHSRKRRALEEPYSENGLDGGAVSRDKIALEHQREILVQERTSGRHEQASAADDHDGSMSQDGDRNSAYSTGVKHPRLHGQEEEDVMPHLSADSSSSSLHWPEHFGPHAGSTGQLGGAAPPDTQPVDFSSPDGSGTQHPPTARPDHDEHIKAFSPGRSPITGDIVRSSHSYSLGKQDISWQYGHDKTRLLPSSGVSPHWSSGAAAFQAEGFPASQATVWPGLRDTTPATAILHHLYSSAVAASSSPSSDPSMLHLAASMYHPQYMSDLSSASTPKAATF